MPLIVIRLSSTLVAPKSNTPTNPSVLVEVLNIRLALSITLPLDPLNSNLLVVVFPSDNVSKEAAVTDNVSVVVLNVRLALSPSSPSVPANTTRPLVKSSTLTVANVVVPSTSKLLNTVKSISNSADCSNLILPVPAA